MVNTFFYFFLYSSAVLIYGIGLNRAAVLSRSIDKTLFFQLIKCTIVILCSTVLTFIIIRELLIPAELVELYPLVALLVFISVSVFVEIIMRITTGFRTSEFTVSYLIILLTLNESLEILDSIVIAVSCMLSFIMILPVLFSLRKRIEIARPKNDKIKKKSLIMFTMAIIIISLSVWDVSWFNQGCV
jgi:Na+-translocating ferredoxin:NAD+ oxidoreductase RnfA subunit